MARTTRSSDCGTSDSRRIGNGLESQLDRELDTKRETYPQLSKMMRRIMNSGSRVPCLYFFLSQMPSDIHFISHCCHQICSKNETFKVSFKDLIGFVKYSRIRYHPTYQVKESSKGLGKGRSFKGRTRKS